MRRSPLRQGDRSVMLYRSLIVEAEGSTEDIAGTLGFNTHKDTLEYTVVVGTVGFTVGHIFAVFITWNDCCLQPHQKEQTHSNTTQNSNSVQVVGSSHSLLRIVWL